jgi:hypothetical protein
VTDGTAGGFHLWACSIEFGHYGIERASHIGARIAIWHGINVQAIDALGMGSHGIAEGHNGLADLFGTQKL